MLLPVVSVLQHSILSLSWLLLPAYASLNVELNVGFHHQLIEAQHGTFLINKRDTWIGLSLSTYGEWEEVTINLLAEFIEEGFRFRVTTIVLFLSLNNYTLSLDNIVPSRHLIIKLSSLLLVMMNK